MAQRGEEQGSFQLPAGFSSYLDLIRFLAAIAVVCEHFGFPRFGAVAMPYGLGHAAVMVFFILSGYVIHYVADTREPTVVLFAASRIARIYSVVIPALFFTILIDILLEYFGQQGEVRAYQLTAPWKYLPFFLLFMSDFWFLHEEVFSNAPFWSLSYEVWYYVAFALFFYLRGRPRTVLIVILALVVGPRLWLLFPLWALGAWIYQAHRADDRPAGRRMSRGLAFVIFCASLAGLCAFIGFGINQQLDVLADRMSGGTLGLYLRRSQFFLADFFLGILIGANIFAARYCGFNFKILSPAIGFLAGNSFTIYLMHLPLMEFYALICGLKGVPLFAATFMSALLFGMAIEHRKRPLRQRLLALWAHSRPAVDKVPVDP